MNTRLETLSPQARISALATKPFSAIELLINHMVPFSERMVIEKGEVMHYYRDEARYCFLLLSGSVALHRRGDGIILNSESAPFVLGVSNQHTNGHMYVRALETSEIGMLALASFNQIIANDNFWEHFARLLMYSASRVYEHCAMISQLSAYDIICTQLVELMQEPESIREHTTAANYIKSRTWLSRSGIMRILSELRTGGYITMQRGVLQEINHLPLKY